jgi:hypothetical protein
MYLQHNFILFWECVSVSGFVTYSLYFYHHQLTGLNVKQELLGTISNAYFPPNALVYMVKLAGTTY